MKTATNLTSLVPMPTNLTSENVTVPALMVAINDYMKRAIKNIGVDVEKLNSYSMFKTHLWGMFGTPEKLFVNGLDDPTTHNMYYEMVANSAAQRIVNFANEHGFDYTEPETMIKYFIIEYTDWFNRIITATARCEEAHNAGLIHVEPYRENPEVIDLIDHAFDQDVKKIYNAACVVAYAWDIKSREDAETSGHAEKVNELLAQFVRPEDVDVLKNAYAA